MKTNKVLEKYKVLDKQCPLLRFNAYLYKNFEIMKYMGSFKTIFLKNKKTINSIKRSFAHGGHAKL